MIDPVVVWLAVAVLLLALLIEAMAKGDRSPPADRSAARSPPTPHSPPSMVDQHTPSWMRRYAQVFDPEQLPTFEQVVGMETSKRELSNAVGSALDAGRNGESGNASTILLWGRRGSGKTVLARAVAGHFGAWLIHVPARCLLPRTGGTTQPQIAMLVRYAQTHTPSVLFIDDLEILTARAPDRRGHVVLHDLLRELGRRDSHAQSIVIAALATDNTVTPPALPAGVFGHAIHVDVPDARTRAALVESLMARRRMVADDPEAIVAVTAGMTRAELIHIIHDACGRALIDRGPAAAVVAPRHLAAVTRALASPRSVAELALSSYLKRDVERLATMLADPDARIGVVFAGDLGTGRTTIARALAASTQRYLITVTPDDARAETMEEKTEQALARRPSLLLIDESPLLESPVQRAVEAGCLPGPHGDRIATAIDRALARPGVSVIAIARRFEAIDADLRQPGRLVEQIWVDYPDAGARLELVRHHLRGVRMRDLSPITVAEELRGLTPAQITVVLEDAVRSAECRMTLAASDWVDDPVVTPSDLWRALQLVTDLPYGAASSA